MANIQDLLAEGVVSSTAIAYTITPFVQNPQAPAALIVLRASVIGTTLTMKIEASTDGSTFDLLYTTPALTPAPRFRRVYFTQFTHVDDTDTAGVDAVIYRPPILQGTIKITVTAVGSCTYSLERISTDPSH
jgi:hypothetical protein